MAPRRKCLTCGSRQWRKNAVGLVACSEGHILQHYINESEEADDVGTHAMRKRTLKSSRKKNEGISRVDPKLYHGDRARFHYYQCLQLLFRKQVAALIVLWNLPPEFEIICRDLWAFRLHLITNPPPAEPFHYTREQEGYQRKPETEIRDRSRSRPGKEVNPCSPVNGALTLEERTSSEDEILAPEIAVLLEESSEVSSSDGEFSSDEPRAGNDTQNSSKNPLVTREDDRPENTIAVLVLACWTIRLPVIYMDFINAIESHSLPYLDHVRAFPSSLTRHLTKHAVQALSPHYAPKTLPLHRLVSHLANRFYETLDIVIPEFNTAPVLWRVVQECFCGTPVLYVLTKRVGKILCLGLSLQGSAPALSLDADRQNAQTRVWTRWKTEAGLPRSSDDAACALPNATELLAAMMEADQAKGSVNSHRFGSRVPLSVGDLDDTTLDEYLDFCQKVLVGPKRDEHRVIDSYFPLTNGTTDLMQGERRDMRGRELSPIKRNDGDMGVLEPGEMYTIYDAKDVLGNLPGDLKVIVDRSAQWAGVDCDFLCGVLERYERRLVRWWNEGKGDDQEGGYEEGTRMCFE